MGLLYYGDSRVIAGDVPENAVVQKSMPLCHIEKSDMNISALKMVDVFLARIDSHDDGALAVMISKSDLQNLLGTVKIPHDRMRGYMNELMRMNIVEGDDDYIHEIAFFSEVCAFRGEDGRWSLLMCCSEKAKPYVFYLEQMGYVKYKLNKVTKLRSKYSYFLFQYLMREGYRKNWTVSVDQLKEELGCGLNSYDATKATTSYKEFKQFNVRVFSPAVSELQANKAISFSSEFWRDHRKITGVTFHVGERVEPVSENAAHVERDRTQMANLVHENEEQISMSRLSRLVK